MWWQVSSALGGLLIAIPAVVIGILAFRRTSQTEDIAARVLDIEKESATRVAAAEVGLEYLRESLKEQRETITRQEGEIGELRGQLKACREERQEMAGRIAELEERMA